MKTKFLVFFLFTAILLAGLVSAVDLQVTPASTTLTQDKSSTEFTIANKNTAKTLDVTFTLPSITDEKGNLVLFNSIADILGLTSSSPVKRSLVASSLDFANFNFGELYTGNLVVAEKTNATNKVTVPVIIRRSFCKYGPVNQSDLSLDVSINNKDNDDETWMPLNEIEIKVTVANEGTEDLDDIIVELGLYDSSGKRVDGDLLWISEGEEKFELGDIDSDEDERATFSFEVDPELGLNGGDYTLFIKAYPEGDESKVCSDTSPDLSETYFQEITIDREDDDQKQVAVYNIDMPATAMCADELNVYFDIANIGEDDQDRVKVTLYNKELGVDLNQEFLENLDQGDIQERLNFAFKVPENAKEKTHILEFRTQYDYSKSSGTYKEISSAYTKQLKVEGCKPVITKDVSLTADELTAVQSGGKAGQQLVVRTNVKNTGQEETTYMLSVSGNENWASVERIEPSTLTLKPSESRDVLITFDVASSVSGEQTFTLKAVYDSSSKQTVVSVPIEGKAGITGLSFLNLSSLQNNWFLWVIVAINVILIVLIIVVAVRMAR